MATPIDRAFVGLNPFQMALCAHAVCAGYAEAAKTSGRLADAPLPHLLLGVLVVSAQSRAQVVRNFTGKTGLAGLMKTHRAVMAAIGLELPRDARTILRAIQFSVEHHFVEVVRMQDSTPAFRAAPTKSAEGRFVRRAQQEGAHTTPLRAARRFGALSAAFTASELYNVLGVQP